MVKPAMLAFSIYIIALLATVICLAQQRAAFTLESRGVITEPVLHFTETVDKGLFIAVFQQSDRFAKTLIIGRLISARLFSDDMMMSA